MEEYDLIVIGAGPAGGGIAALMAEAGKFVVMFEDNGVGGVCPLRGCNPKKVLMSVPEAIHKAEHLKGKGAAGEIRAKWSDMASFRDTFTQSVPERATMHYENLGIEVIESRARFTGPNTVEAGGVTYTAPHVAICSGNIPRQLNIPGSGFLLTSDDFLDLNSLPRNLAFIGGGFIAFEFAHIAARCGSNVSIFIRGDKALRGFDQDLVAELVKATEEAGITVHFNAPVTAVEQRGSAYAVLCGGPEPAVIADAVINCAGRIPATDDLDLEKANVDQGPNGITVTKQMQSVSNPAVFALGDVADTPYGLTPTATLESIVAAKVMQGDANAAANYAGIPSTCFTLPPLSRVGMLDAEAEEAGIDFTVKETDLADSFPWKRLGEAFGKSRVLIDKQRGVVIGAHILGHHAEEIANTFALIIRHEIPIDQVRDTPWVYPTSGYYLKYML